MQCDKKICNLEASFLTLFCGPHMSEMNHPVVGVFSRGERQKFARKKVCIDRVSNSQAPGHESYTLTTEPHGRVRGWRKDK